MRLDHRDGGEQQLERFQFDSSLDFVPDVGAEGWQQGRRTLFTGALGVLKTEVHVLTQGSYSKAILPPS